MDVSYKIRPAVTEDIGRLMLIEETCFPEDHFSRRQMRYLLTKAKAKTLVACYEEVVAYIQCFTPALPKPARLYSLAVLPAFQKKGIARALMTQVLSEVRAEGYHSCYLEVRHTDKDTQRLYESFGFVALSVIKNYYENGDAALKMRCKLSD